MGKLAYGGAANKYVAAERQTQSVRAVTLSVVVLPVVISVVFPFMLPFMLPYHLDGLQLEIFTLYAHVHIYASISTRDTEILIVH